MTRMPRQSQSDTGGLCCLLKGTICAGRMEQERFCLLHLACPVQLSDAVNVECSCYRSQLQNIIPLSKELP